MDGQGALFVAAVPFGTCEEPQCPCLADSLGAIAATEFLDQALHVIVDCTGRDMELLANLRRRETVRGKAQNIQLAGRK